MKKVRYIAIAVFFVAAFIMGSYSQDRTVISGLGSDSLYMALIVQESSLRSKEDSLNAKVTETRALFRTYPDNRNRYAEDILRLESEIFDVRNLIGITVGRINTIEQEYIIQNLSHGGESGDTRQEEDIQEEKSGVVVLNPFFEDNLHADDYATLIEAQKKESAVLDAINSFAENYTQIALIATQMPLAETAEEADSLYRKYEVLRGLNEKYSQVAGNELGFVYDNKLYCYNYILDKLGRRSQLSSFERKIAETREQAITAGQSAESPEIAEYPYRKALLLDYEKTLAGIAGYKKATDSLAGVRSALSKMNFDFPAIAVEEKLFLDYSDITFHTPAIYDSRNPVPQLTVHPKGEIYRILLGSFPRAQQVSILRGAFPVGVLQQDGKYDYYAGGFESLEAAVQAAEQLKAKGFRDPKIARWTNGQYKLFTQNEVDRLLGNVEAGLFRLAIDTGDKPLPAIVREIMEDTAPGTEISRSGNLYIIGPFESRTEARELMEHILDETDGLDIKIETIEAD